MVLAREARYILASFLLLLILLAIEWLPQFNFVAVGIVYPGEATIAFILALRINADACLRQAVEQGIEVIDDVVHHERGWARCEVAGVAGENAPDGHLLTFILAKAR